MGTAAGVALLHAILQGCHASGHGLSDYPINGPLSVQVQQLLESLQDGLEAQLDVTLKEEDLATLRRHLLELSEKAVSQELVTVVACLLEVDIHVVSRRADRNALEVTSYSGESRNRAQGLGLWSGLELH